MTTLTKIKVTGDVLVHVESLTYCCKNSIIRNGAAAGVTLTDPVGMFVKAGTNGADFNLAVSTDEASVIGIIVKAEMNGEVIGATTNSVGRYLVLHKTPCIVNKSRLPATDPASVAWVGGVAAIVTALEALGFKFVAHPVKLTEQTT